MEVKEKKIDIWATWENFPSIDQQLTILHQIPQLLRPLEVDVLEQLLQRRDFRQNSFQIHFLRRSFRSVAKFVKSQQKRLNSEKRRRTAA